MARLLTAGAETISAIGEDKTMEGSITSVGAVTVDTGTVHGGVNSFKCDAGAGNAAAYVAKTFTGASGVTYYARVWFNIPSAPSANTHILAFFTAAVGNLNSIQVNTDGTVMGNVTGGGTSGNVCDGSWHCVELHIKINTAAGSDDDGGWRLDGTVMGSFTNSAVGTVVPGLLRVGWPAIGFPPGANKIIYADDIALNDSNAGAGSTSYPGLGKVVLLRPISDNARATLWTGGAGGTTSLFDAVDNIPPAGTASETNTTQIEHAGGAAGTTDAYDANMTTPAAAGIAAADAVNLAYFLEVDGEDVSTGAKLLNFEVLSNPVIASPGDVTAGNGSALGTYPTNWVIRQSAITYQPSVIVGTSPVMRARRPETASRVASVCFMGIIMDYTPAVVVSSPPDRGRRRRAMQRTRV